MANAEHLEILKSGVEKWNVWRKENYGIEPDLSNISIRDWDLSYINMESTDLSNTNLCNTNFENSNLHNVNLKDAKLDNTNFKFSIMSAINLRGADLHHIDLEHTSLVYASLDGANLSGARLNSCNLRGANLTGTNLNNATLSFSDLSDSSLEDADLTNSNLNFANLSNANLKNSNLANSEFRDTILCLTDLSTCKGLESIVVSGPCAIDLFTLRASKNLPKEFLTKLGIPDLLLEYLPDFYNPALMIYPAFLSHSWADKPFVRKLYETLSKQGVTVWLDEKKLKSGDNIHDSISEGIKYFDKLILVCSENSLNSWWVEKELEKVYEKEREMQKERGKKFRLVIPIRIDDHILNWKEGILTTVRNSVIGDFTQWQDDAAFEKAVKELVDALNANRVDIRPPSLL